MCFLRPGLSQTSRHTCVLCPWRSCSSCCWGSASDNEGTKNACAASRPLLWFQGLAYSKPPGKGVLIKTHDASGCNQSPVRFISWVPWLSISCQQIHNETFPSCYPWISKPLTFPAHRKWCGCADICICLNRPLCFFNKVINKGYCNNKYTARTLQANRITFMQRQKG